jgi:hypothetical protein
MRVRFVLFSYAASMAAMPAFAVDEGEHNEVLQGYEEKCEFRTGTPPYLFRGIRSVASSSRKGRLQPVQRQLPS